MAFVTDGSGNVTSYAEYTDVLQKDQRLIEANVIKVPAESGFVCLLYTSPSPRDS